MIRLFEDTVTEIRFQGGGNRIPAGPESGRYRLPLSRG